MPELQWVSIEWRGRNVEIEYQWVGNADKSAPILVFLHEGLGSVAMWRDFPDRLATAAGCRGLVYSRPGYGQSTPRTPTEVWQADFLHQQAYEVLPALLQALALSAQQPLYLFGHSDGASISLLYAAQFPTQVRAAIVLAPHIMVEDMTLDSIQAARNAYLNTALKQKLSRYHADPDSAFWGWNKVWLSDAFRNWSIEDELLKIRCPLLVIQGIEDEYGSLEHVDGIARRVPIERHIWSDCGHSPHRDQPLKLITTATHFINRHM